MLKHVIFIIITSIVLLIGVYLFDRDNLFNLPKGNALIWMMLCIFYPLFSAFGQEIIYRLFLFYRYRNIFKNDKYYIIASGIAFSFAHIVYYSHISIILTLLLGIYFANAYTKTKSVLFTSLIHGFLGDVIFTIGLGSYFWLDMHQWL
ncbi:type II CAAX prenyl endopeptidase Rce1 family protein [Bacteroidota bacterium]